MDHKRLLIIENFYMPELKRNRTLRIYLPADYEQSTKQYPVLYMHDAQNLFDVSTSSFGDIWDVGTVLDEQFNKGETDGVIIVGIDNGLEWRYAEYSPFEDLEVAKLMPHVLVTPKAGGEGFLYADFIANTLKPYIDQNFRTKPEREYTAVCGSSMGGIISLAIGLKYQDVFSKVGALSTAAFFGEKDLVQYILNVGKKMDMKIYMDVGTKETSNAAISEFSNYYKTSNQTIYQALKDAGFTDNDVRFEMINEGIHNEKEWNKRFPHVIKYLKI